MSLLQPLPLLGMAKNNQAALVNGGPDDLQVADTRGEFHLRITCEFGAINFLSLLFFDSE